jgi:mannose-1-phosphate guanylyltransferase
MIHAMIMAGGKGTRFWPLSRNSKPKQFLNILTSKTLLEDTISRLKPFIKPDNVWILGNDAYKKHYRSILAPLPASQILYEPEAKNTAACIGWAAIEVLRKDPDAIMVVLPSDHYIAPSASFRKLLKRAVDLVKAEDCLVTIGIIPTFPHTGYGYIEVDHVQPGSEQVLRFHEKPELEKATEYVRSGRFYWNSGMFIWSAKKILALFKQYLPKHYDLLMKIEKNPASFKDVFSQFENISIDYGIMEKATAETKLLESNFEWNDIGSWSAVEKFWPQDSSENAVKGDVLCVNSSRNVVYASSKKTILVDVHDMVVVDTPDVLMVLPKMSDQKTKDLQPLLPSSLL